MKYGGPEVFRADTKVQGIRLAAVTPRDRPHRLSHRQPSLGLRDLLPTTVRNLARQFPRLRYFRPACVGTNPDENHGPGHIPGNQRGRAPLPLYTKLSGAESVLIFDTPSSRRQAFHGRSSSEKTRPWMSTWISVRWRRGDDFIHAIFRRTSPARPRPRRYLSMVRLQWNGRIIGPSDGPPTFQGPLSTASTRATTNSLSILLMGDMDLFSKRIGHRPGATPAVARWKPAIDGLLQLTDWEFRPENPVGSAN